MCRIGLDVWSLLWCSEQVLIVKCRYYFDLHCKYQLNISHGGSDLGHEGRILAVLHGLVADVCKGGPQQVPLTTQLPAQAVVAHQLPGHQGGKRQHRRRDDHTCTLPLSELPNSRISMAGGPNPDR